MSDPVFFEPSRRFSVAEIATLTGAELQLSGADREISALASLEDGRAGVLVFADGKRHSKAVAASRATAILCTADLASSVPPDSSVLITPAPQRAFALVGRMMYPAAARPAPLTGETGISPAASVHPTASIEEGVVVEAGAVIGPGAGIGSGSIISATCVVGENVQIGRGCYVGPGATLQCALVGNGVIIHAGARIGQDGFGYVPGQSGVEKMPQLGRVIIQDNVEIGANTTIDRGALSDTVIGENTKIDNLVQIAHNVKIGRSCLIAGKCGLSGSVTLGDGVMLGGGVGVADHLTIGSGAAVAAGSGLMHNVPPGEKWGGSPAMPMWDYLRGVAMLRKLAHERAGRTRDNG